MRTRALQEDPLKGLAAEINGYFNDRKVHFFGIDYSGQREMNRFLDALNRYTTPGFEFTSSGVGMDDRRDERFGEFRRIRGLKHYTGDDKTTDFVAVENTAIYTGTSAISGPIGILYGMSENRIPGKGCVMVYLMTTEGDTLGLSNFAAVRDFRRYVGIKRHMKAIAPATFIDLGERNMIRQISEHEPELRVPRKIAIADTLDAVGEIVKKVGALML